jgi:tetratricopeptide (TPR) repeat protein
VGDGEADGVAAPGGSETPGSSDRLASWKEVAAYLGREVRTVQRWEKRERLPIHRHHHERSGTIYASRRELDAWLASRSAEPAASPLPGDRIPSGGPRRRSRAGIAVAVVALAALGSLASLRGFDTPPTRTRRPSFANPAALEAWQRGRHQLDRGTGRGYAEALASFGEAVALDPDSAAAHVGLADAWLMLGRHAYRPPAETLPQAKAAARQAERLDPAAPGLQAVLAGVYFYWDWDFAAAEAAYRRALALEPGSARGHHGLAHFLSAMGRHDEALEASRRARALEPLSVAIHSDAAWFLYRARRYEEALAESRRALALEPGFGSALLCAVSILARRGEHAEAVAELRQAARLARLPELEERLAGTEPEAVLERFHRWRLERLLRSEDYVSPFAFVSAYTSLGEIDAAFEWLEKAYAARDRSLLLLKVNPGYDPLRSDPRLDELAARVGLPQPS